MAASDLPVDIETNESEFLQIIREPGPRSIEISSQVILPLPESVFKPTLETLCKRLNNALLKYGKYVVWLETGEIRTMCGDDILELRRKDRAAPGRREPKGCSVQFQGLKTSDLSVEKEESVQKLPVEETLSDEEMDRKLAEKILSSDSILIQVVNRDDGPPRYHPIKDPFSPSILIEVIYTDQRKVGFDEDSIEEIPYSALKSRLVKMRNVFLINVYAIKLGIEPGRT